MIHSWYFDGREWQAHEVWETEIDSVTITHGEESLHSIHGNWETIHSFEVEPPTRCMYPREIESIDEVKMLYVEGEITEVELEDCLERLLEKEEGL